MDGDSGAWPPVCAPCRSGLCGGCLGAGCWCEHLCLDGRLVMGGHDYVSTACHHAEHEPALHGRCRLRCKYCATPCRCDCHTVRAQEPPRG